MRWTPDEYQDYMRRRNAQIEQQRNAKTGGAGAASVVEPSAGHAALGKTQAKGRDTAKFLVRLTSRRKRLLDQDNLCEKYHVDCLRYAGIIPSDAPSQTRIEVCQIKTAKGEPEEIHIEVSQL
jgi:hypothetical protein